MRPQRPWLSVEAGGWSECGLKGRKVRKQDQDRRKEKRGDSKRRKKAESKGSEKKNRRRRTEKRQRRDRETAMKSFAFSWFQVQPKSYDKVLLGSDAIFGNLEEGLFESSIAMRRTTESRWMHPYFLHSICLGPIELLLFVGPQTFR